MSNKADNFLSDGIIVTGTSTGQSADKLVIKEVNFSFKYTCIYWKWTNNKKFKGVLKLLVL